jgi:hypothetical protein
MDNNSFIQTTLTHLFVNRNEHLTLLQGQRGRVCEKESERKRREENKKERE